MVRQSFFSSSEVQARKPVGLIPQCGKCGLWQKCISPKMPISGKGKLEILIIGEGPGKDEDDQNRPFVGKAGTYLKDTLSRLGINMREDCWLTNSVICRPPKNATPTASQILHCRPNIVNAIRDLKPKVIIPLGGPAVRSVLGWVWKESVGKISRWVNWQIPCQKLNCWIVPNIHPSYVKRSEDRRGNLDPVIERLFIKYLKQAVSKRSRPWTEVPNFKSKCQVLMCPSQAVQYLQALVKMRRPVAFDFETEGLKPDPYIKQGRQERLEIVSCSASNGVITISYPWQGAAIKATRDLIQSPLPKIAANLKFEERFCWQHFGTPAINWTWDTVVAAHTLDNRPGVASLKFQSFVLLGQEAYDESIKPFLESKDKGGYAKNRIHEVGLEKLLLYGALDSLLEFEVAKIQSKKLGMDLFSGIREPES